MAINCLLELSSPNQEFEGIVLVKDFQEGKTAGGAPFFNLTLAKKKKQVSAKLWSNSFYGSTVDELKDFFAQNNLLHVKGTSSEYQGNLQMTITHMGTADNSANLSDFLESAPIPIQELQADYERFIGSIKTPILNKICHDLYRENKDTFLNSAAAKSNHHAFLGGLVYHTVTMLKLADFVSNLYPAVNRDLMVAGIALHDIGKVVELTGYTSPDYTKVGNLLGHITIGNMLIDRKVQEYRTKGELTKEDGNKIYELMHCVSAHHGKLEWGSPVTPKLLEAELIHQIDMIDSRANTVMNIVDDENLTPNDLIRAKHMGAFFKTIK